MSLKKLNEEINDVIKDFIQQISLKYELDITDLCKLWSEVQSKTVDYETKRKEKQLKYFDENMLHEELIEDNKHLIQGGKRFGNVSENSGETCWLVRGQTKRFGKTIKIPYKTFNFKKYGSKENAKLAAYAYRDKMSDKLGLTKNRWWRDPKNSKRCFGIVFSPYKGRKSRQAFTFPYAMIDTFKKYTWYADWLGT